MTGSGRGAAVRDGHDLATSIARRGPAEVPTHVFARIRARNAQSAVDAAHVEAVVASARSAISARVWELGLTLARVVAGGRRRGRRGSRRGGKGRTQ